VQNVLSLQLIYEDVLKENYNLMCCFFYGCETWCFVLRQECGLMVFQNRALRIILVYKRERVTRGWKKNCIIKSCKLQLIVLKGKDM
jgi:hypothetical protein